MSRLNVSRELAHRVVDAEASRVMRADRAVDVLLAVLIGIFGALLCAHWWAS